MVERRLAAILAADVVGYSRMIRADEEGTLLALRRVRQELIDPKIEEHRGRIVKLMGDGLLIEFASVVDAVACSGEVQHEMAKRNSNIPEDEQIVFRVGINLGDVIIDGDDIQGDGVNVAARLEGLSEPGGMCISDAVHEQVRDRLELRFEDLGAQEVKNIDRPVRAWRWTASTSEAASTSSAIGDSVGLQDKPSVAVLPFTNMSGDKEQEYFSDGITEDLITEISRFRELAVVSRNSSFVFKGGNESLREVSGKLNAQYIVEGSVRKAGDRIRVTAQLIDARDDAHIWAERYDRALEDIFDVQDDIVRRIAGILVGRLAAERLTKIKNQSDDQLRAYDLFLRGRAHFFNWSIKENRKASQCLRSALDIEPDNAAAMALLSEVLLRMWLNGWSSDANADLQSALELAERADEIDADDSRTQTSLGMAYLFNGDPDKARHHFETALRINPNDTRVIVYYSRHAVFDGDIEKAVDLCRQALTLNPYGKYNWNLGLASFAARDYAGAIALLGAIRNPPESVLALLAASYAMVGNLDAAQQTYQRFSKAIEGAPVMRALDQPSDWQKYYAARWPFRDKADFEHLTHALRKAGLPI